MTTHGFRDCSTFPPEHEGRIIRPPRGRVSRQHAWPDHDWPPPAEPRMASILAEDIETLWREHGLDPDLLTLPGSGRLISCIGGHSPFLSDLVRQNPFFFADLLREGPDVAAKRVLSDLQAMSPTAPRERIFQTMRIAKQRIALACALAEISHFQELEQTTQTLSALAEAALDLGVRHLLRSAHDAGRLSLPDPENPARRSGYVVLAMGKLGARELNFSSDIDLVVLFDPEMHQDPDAARTVLIRMTTDLVRLMEARDAYGYVFRTDLRLRPDPSATPPAVSIHAAISYYESMGQTWERAAMTRARPVAGDITLGRRFLSAIYPFIWRKHLDFALIDDIHDMKRKIDHYRRTGTVRFGAIPDAVLREPAAAAECLFGHNLKLGEGGIREIEFITQAMQLIWGGRLPALRHRTTLGALRVLVRSGHIPADEAAELSRSYRFLREIEHRVQMRADQQTHLLPLLPDAFNALGLFLGYGASASSDENNDGLLSSAGANFALDLLPHMRAVRRIFDRHFVSQPEGEEAVAKMVDFDDPDLATHLETYGLSSKAAVAAASVMRHWADGSRRALQSERAYSLLSALAPSLLTVFAARRDPAACVRYFDALLSRQRAGVQLLSLLQHNPALIGRIADIFDASPVLAAHLADTPSALEGLLEVHEEEEGHVSLSSRIANLKIRVQELAEALTDTETLINRLRPLVRAEEFRLCVARLERRISEDEAAAERTALADAVISELLKSVTVIHEERHGRPKGGGMVVVVLGKAGSREMMVGSDLDLMMIFDHRDDDDAETKEGRKKLAPAQYFGRLAHALIAALTAPDAEGPLYSVDMRLRPSGASGPVAVSRSAFLRYHEEAAWTWERMALTRARVIAGPDRLKTVLRRDISGILDRPARDPATGQPMTAERIRVDVVEMRRRLARDLPASGPWDIKRRDGGLMEVEFIAQALQLIACDAKARSPETRVAFSRLAKTAQIAPADARFLIKADETWRGLQSLLRILCGRKPPESLMDSMPVTTRELLIGDMQALSQEDLLGKMKALSGDVRKMFEKIIGKI